MSNIYQYKLATGEEIIGELIEEDDDFLYYRNVLTINKMFIDNSIIHTMNSWISGQFSDDDDTTVIAINPSHITSSNIPTENILDQYHKCIAYYIQDDNYLENQLDLDSNSDSDKISNIISFRSNLIH